MVKRIIQIFFYYFRPFDFHYGNMALFVASEGLPVLVITTTTGSGHILQSTNRERWLAGFFVTPPE